MLVSVRILNDSKVNPRSSLVAFRPYYEVSTPTCTFLSLRRGIVVQILDSSLITIVDEPIPNRRSSVFLPSSLRDYSSWSLCFIHAKFAAGRQSCPKDNVNGSKSHYIYTISTETLWSSCSVIPDPKPLKRLALRTALQMQMLK